MTALFIAFVIGPAMIAGLRVSQGSGQPIRTDGPARHIIEKQGTPTMGGLLILISSIAATLLWAEPHPGLCVGRPVRHDQFRPARFRGRLSEGHEAFTRRRERQYQIVDPGRSRGSGIVRGHVARGAVAGRDGGHSVPQNRSSASRLGLSRLRRPCDRGRVERGQSHRRPRRVAIVR